MLGILAFLVILVILGKTSIFVILASHFRARAHPQQKMPMRGGAQINLRPSYVRVWRSLHPPEAASNRYPLSCVPTSRFLQLIHLAQLKGKARKRRPTQTRGRLLFNHGLGSRVHTRTLEADLV